MTDAEFLARYVRDRDQHAFAAIVARHAGLVAAAARRLAPAEADDVAQAAFVLLARHAPSLLTRTSLAGWLYQTTRRCAANARKIRRRRERRLALAAAREATMSPTSSHNDLAALLDGALAALPTSMRDVVLLRHLEALSVAETAERLGVPMTTVTKRSERGLSRLRDFFAARGHSSLQIAGVTTALAAIAASSTPADAGAIAAGATSTSVAPSVVALTKAASPLPFAIAGVVVVAAAIATAAAVRVDRPKPATPAQPTVIAAAMAPTTSPVAGVLAGVTQEDGKAMATLFLDRLRSRDAAGVAALLAVEGDANATAAAMIRDLRDGEYARFPQRLAIGGNGSFEMEPTIFNADGTRQPTSPGGPRMIGATLEAQTPIEADIGRAVLTLRVVGDAWRITGARFVADGVTDVGRRVDLGAGGGAAGSVSADAAQRALDAWDRAERASAAFDTGKLTAGDVPALRAGMAEYDAAFAAFVAALRNTPLAVSDADASLTHGLCAKAIDLADHGSFDALQLWMRGVDKEPAVTAAGARLTATIEKLKASVDAADEAKPGTPRPAPFGPDVTLRLAWLHDKPVRLHGPLVFPEWLRTTRAWQQWERQHDMKTFRTRDDAGNAYEVAIGGTMKNDAAGKALPCVTSVRQYRADGTLAAVAEYGWDDFASSWGEFDATGRRYTFRVSSRAGNTKDPEGINEVKFFAPDGTIRYWYTSHDAQNRVWWDRVQDAIGEHDETIHLVHSNGSDDGDPADDLPIEELPITLE